MWVVTADGVLVNLSSALWIDIQAVWLHSEAQEGYAVVAFFTTDHDDDGQPTMTTMATSLSPPRPKTKQRPLERGCSNCYTLRA
jgi:hypothetical protein